MDRPNKLQRLEQFRRRVPHGSASALSKILAEVEASGVPELQSRDDIRDARDAMATRLTPYGAVLQDMQLVPKAPHGPIRLLYLHPLAMLYTAFAHADGFSQFFKSRLAEHPPSPRVPWSLILYSDEITPGNVLAPDNRRKIQAVYMSFMEFAPPGHLSDDVQCTSGLAKALGLDRDFLPDDLDAR